MLLKNSYEFNILYMKYNSNRSTNFVKNILYQIKIKNSLSKEIGNFDLCI